MKSDVIFSIVAVAGVLWLLFDISRSFECSAKTPPLRCLKTMEIEN